MDKSIMEKINSNLGRHIKNIREKSKKTLHQVAIGADIDSTILSKIERGERFPTVEQIKRLADFYGISEELLKTKFIAEKIIKDYGLNDTTLNAILLVREEFMNYPEGNNHEQINR
jgi:transcriptional regulator with XRE-family HTH domain